MNTLHRLHSLALGLSIALGALAGHAQTATATDDTLFQAFGGQRGLVVLMDDFMVRLLADARMNPFFKETDQKHIKEQLVVQFCQLSGGPCKLAKPDMKKPHSGVDITVADFNALVEDLAKALTVFKVPAAEQGELVAILAPLQPDIVTA